MPTVRVMSLQTTYKKLDGHRLALAKALRATASTMLSEKIEGVEAFWPAPVQDDDADNMLPISIDVEYGVELDETQADKLADAILWIFTHDPYTSRNISFGTAIGVWIKTPGLFYWKETVKQAKQVVAKRSVFPFFDGDRALVIAAPDDAETDQCWEIETQTRDREKLSTRGARPSVSLGSLSSLVFEALYQGISSSETDRLRPEIQRWLNDVHEAYRTRNHIKTLA